MDAKTKGVLIIGIGAALSYGADKIDSVQTNMKSTWPQTIKTDSTNRRYLYLDEEPIMLDSALFAEHDSSKDKMVYEGVVAGYGGNHVEKAKACSANGYAYVDITDMLADTLSAKAISDSIIKKGTDDDISIQARMPKTYRPEINVVPNPFAENTAARFATQKPGNVKADVYNLEGKVVKNVFNGYKPAGYHTLNWDGTTKNGTPANSGAYIFKIQGNKPKKIFKR